MKTRTYIWITIAMIMSLVELTGCVCSKDITTIRDHFAVRGNPYCVKDAILVVQYPLRMTTSMSRAGGYGLYEAPFPEGQMKAYGPDERTDTKGYLRPGDTVRVEKVYWVTHFDVGDHLEIRARILSGVLKGLAVDLGSVQDAKYLKPVNRENDKKTK
ncbi:MAG: hypothetical protein PHR77_09350 [Kiritimatiellae bacterium]|nr:hypothetical protein [Kiritimatiellia bacterium]MDD5522943.1 hypothetical protein [Kiritimatiellia bacterium]